MRKNEYRKSENHQRGLTLNFYEIVIDKKTIKLHRANYSKESFDYYKSTLDSFYYYRYQDSEGDWIYAWKRNELDEYLPEGFAVTDINLNEHPTIFAKIIEESIVQLFIRNKYNIRKVKYSSMWEVDLQKEERRSYGGLDIIPTLVFSIQNLYSKRTEKQILVLTTRRRYRPSFTISERVINQKQVDTRDWTRNDKEEIVASKVNVKKFLEATGQLKDYDNFLKEVQTDNKHYDCLVSDLKDFQDVAKKLYLPEDLTIKDFFLMNVPNTNFKIMTFWKPHYYYYNERTQGGLYDRALADLGPYSKDLFRNRKIEVLVIAPKEYEGDTGEYIFKLEKKLKNIFHLQDICFDLKSFDDPPKGYVKVLQNLDVQKYNLALVIVSEEHKLIAIENSPYHQTKAKLLNQRIPSQDILIEKLRQSTNPLENNLALNIYTKLGGTAWTIEKAEKNIPELIIGIGSTLDSNKKRIIGFANVFDHNGAYIVGDCSQLSTLEDYCSNLEEYLLIIIQQALQWKAINTEQQVRLLFHLYKDAAKNYEIKAIMNVLGRFKFYNIQYGIAHLSYAHNFRMFKDGGKSKPDRGTFVQISTLQGLLHLGGSSEIPILIRLDKRADYKDLHATAKQILSFAHLSYRSFRPSNVPVTITYSSLMAKMVSELSSVSNWDPDILNKMSDKLWFI